MSSSLKCVASMAFCESCFFFLLLRCAFLLFCCLLLLLPPTPLACDPNDLNALRSFAAPLLLTNWSSSSCCNWDGVRCDDNASSPRVIELLLPNRGLSGPIPPNSLSSLSRLRSLDLSRNSLSGPLPPDLSSLTRLEHLNLSYNAMSGGAIPPMPPSLRSLDLSSNSFNSPSFLLLGPNLSFLNISNNSLSGALPDDAFSNCTASLRDLHLGWNRLSGPLPASLFRSLSLRRLSLPFNAFSGRLLPDNLAALSSLKSLVLSGNRLSGPLPDAFHNLTSLDHLLAHSNSFSGPLPKSLSLCSSLRELDLRNNSLSGPLDLDFSALPLLASLDLASNHFTGPLPVSLATCRQLKTLSLAKNALSGQIPDEFRSLESLSFLSLSNNTFRNVSGALALLRECRNLTTLILTRNFHGERVPELSAGFPNLGILALGNCALSGEIPAWLTDCRKLQVLDLSWNRFNGTIPPWIGRFDSLIYLDVSNNSLTGEIPKSLTQLKSLNLQQGTLNGSSIDMPLYVKRNQSVLGLQYNQVSSFPPSLYLNDNGINGSIWPEFGHLKALHVLDLSNNDITGTIPDTIATMENLEVLDLSCNNLNGSIPQSLSRLTFLSKFSVANNRLEGVIPGGGQFFSFSNSSFEGNPGLCRASEGSCNKTSVVVGVLPEISSRMSSRIGKSTILGITISIGAGIAVLLAVLLLNLSRREVVDPSNEDEDEEYGLHRMSDSGSKLVLFFQNADTTNKELTIGDLLKSTNNFDQANIIGCGGFGLVYKAYLPHGTKAAIKRLSGDCGQMEREFRAEVETLSRAQHRNLVSLKGYCRYGSDRLLIYSYMENGSLDYWLHERAEGGSHLRWECRLKIAQGSARGLFYLHKECEPHIIHRDVKSSNILLDEKFEAHLADFGLARLIRPYDTHVTTDLVGTLGYIPPEYSQTLTATLKGDVFSFGVVLLELLTGRRPVDVCKGRGGCRDLVSWVLRMKSEGKEEQVFDAVIWSKAKERQLMVVLETACRCICPDPRHRPSIEQVVMWLDDGLGADT